MIIYKRVLLKLSGESLMGKNNAGIDPDMLVQYAREIRKAKDLNVELAIVIGGGNIYRGMNEKHTGIARVQGDYMGMVATIINGMALQSALEKEGMDTRLMSNIKVDEVAEPYIRRRALRHISKGRIVIFCGGTGNPYFTTDTAGVLKALEIQADAIIKGTRVNGIYDKDPENFLDASLYETISVDKALADHLYVMDATALTLCQENNLPLIVFNMNEPNNLMQLIRGGKIGTTVHPSLPSPSPSII